MVGVALLVALTVVAAVVVGTFSLGTGPPDAPPKAALTVAADPGTDRIALTHRSGDELDVAELGVRIRVDGRPLDDQPPVPFVGAPGFDGAPGGPFNAAGDTRWTAGESASLTIAGTNSPGDIDAGDRVTVRVYATGELVTATRTTA